MQAVAGGVALGVLKNPPDSRRLATRPVVDKPSLSAFSKQIAHHAQSVSPKNIE
jgi:hypothetical protein